MAITVGSATLTASFDTIGEATLLLGSWREGNSGGRVGVRFKHTKHGSQSGGYPVVRIRTQVSNVAGSTVTSIDPVVDSAITIVGSVATVKAYDGAIELHALKDSDGTVECTLTIVIPAYHSHILVQAKQAGDTVNFGTLTVELDGRI